MALLKRKELRNTKRRNKAVKDNGAAKKTTAKVIYNIVLRKMYSNE